MSPGQIMVCQTPSLPFWKCWKRCAPIKPTMTPPSASTAGQVFLRWKTSRSISCEWFQVCFSCLQYIKIKWLNNIKIDKKQLVKISGMVLDWFYSSQSEWCSTRLNTWSHWVGLYKFHSYAIKFRQSKDRPLLGLSDSKKWIHPLVLSKPGFCNAALTVRPN